MKGLKIVFEICVQETPRENVRDLEAEEQSTGKQPRYCLQQNFMMQRQSLLLGHILAVLILTVRPNSSSE